jgi:hypothetical protein
MAGRRRLHLFRARARAAAPVVVLLVPAAAAAAIVLSPPGAGERTVPAGAKEPEPRARAPRTLTIGWVGDVTLGPSARAGNVFARVRGALREPDLMAANLEGTLSIGGVSKCSPGAASCFAFQAPPAGARTLRDAGIDIVNLANNHAFDFGEPGRMQTLRALTGSGVAFVGLPGNVRVLEKRGVRVAFVGFSTYRWAPSMNDPGTVRALVDQAAAMADIVVVLFHGGAEGATQTAVPRGREWAFGEDRGDSRAFAHAAIDAGADLVVGSGPHVVRGLETYRRRLIAYSLGNFAAVGGLSTGGVLSTSGLLTVRLDRRGRLRNGWWHGITLDASGAPRPDRGASRALVAKLSARDFGAAAPRMLSSGRILPAVPQ